jgi:ABC-type dipeptide/oligopeptide/nickel transport system ATPase component
VRAGEPPDPTRMPAGCRFHPRCPQLASGEAAAAGVDGDCRTASLPVLPASKEHTAACFLSAARQGMLTD